MPLYNRPILNSESMDEPQNCRQLDRTCIHIAHIFEVQIISSDAWRYSRYNEPAARHELSEQYHVRNIGIFGSYSRECQTEQSDLDLVVEFDQPIGMMAFVHLKNLIANRLAIKVDLVTPEGLHPLIRDLVMHEVVYV